MIILFLIFCFLMVLSIYMIIIRDFDKMSSREKVFFLSIPIIITSLTLSFSSTNMVCNKIMKSYEEGNIQKEYTIRGTDTTYR